MKNNKYQITGNKGRLPLLGFVLLIVLLSACKGGYDPVEEAYIEFKEGKDSSNAPILFVTVHISSKTSSKTEKNEQYKVEWDSEDITYTDATPKPDNPPSDPSIKKREISKRTTFVFEVKGTPTVTFTVTLLVYEADGITIDEKNSKKVANKPFTYPSSASP